jgi:hypothetical protein
MSDGFFASSFNLAKATGRMLAAGVQAGSTFMDGLTAKLKDYSEGDSAPRPAGRPAPRPEPSDPPEG